MSLLTVGAKGGPLGAMDIEFPAGKKLELWVRDTGLFDGIAIFLNGAIIKRVGDQCTHKFSIARPKDREEVSVTFGGNDGGITAIVDTTDPDQNIPLARQDASAGLTHKYVLLP
jgi:hypothetical protein